MRANLGQRAYGAVLNARAFVHASWGSYVHVSTSLEGQTADADGCGGAGRLGGGRLLSPVTLAEHDRASPCRDYQGFELIAKVVGVFTTGLDTRYAIYQG